MTQIIMMIADKYLTYHNYLRSIVFNAHELLRKTKVKTSCSSCLRGELINPRLIRGRCVTSFSTS